MSIPCSLTIPSPHLSPTPFPVFWYCKRCCDEHLYVLVQGGHVSLGKLIECGRIDMVPVWAWEDIASSTFALWRKPNTVEETQLLWDCHAVRKSNPATWRGHEWEFQPAAPAKTTWEGWNFQIIPACSFQLFQLRSQTVWNRDKPSPLCSVWMPNPQNHKR